VLSAGGLRGAAHVGVLRALVRHRIPIDVIVGVSAGAVIAAYYAAVGLAVDDFLTDAESFRGRHLLTYCLRLHLGDRFDRVLGSRCGVIPNRLAQLVGADFGRLHHGIAGLGIVCHDIIRQRPCYFATGLDQGAKLHDVVRASAAIPYMFPARSLVAGGNEWRLSDGGISDPVPVEFARRPPLRATHLIVSDCRWIRRRPDHAPDVAWVRPRLASTGTLWAPREGLLAAVEQGELAVTASLIAQIRSWLSGQRARPDGSPEPLLASPGSRPRSSYA
jgi:NTE family protein